MFDRPAVKKVAREVFKVVLRSSRKSVLSIKAVLHGIDLPSFSLSFLTLVYSSEEGRGGEGVRMLHRLLNPTLGLHSKEKERDLPSSNDILSIAANSHTLDSCKEVEGGRGLGEMSWTDEERWHLLRRDERKER